MTKRKKEIKDRLIKKGEPNKKIKKHIKNIEQINRTVISSKNRNKKEKYNLWLSREISRDPFIIKKKNRIKRVIDWAFENRIDIFKYSFKEAFEQQKKENTLNLEYDRTQKIDHKYYNLDSNRVLFNDKEGYFFYLLSPEDLDLESSKMKNCLSGRDHKLKVHKKDIMIVSMRDLENEPHVNIEIDVKNSKNVRQLGYNNSFIKDKYKPIVRRFAFYISGFIRDSEKEEIDHLNKEFI